MVIVDGTGDSDNSKYAKSMKHSFCRQLFAKLLPHSAYLRGPCTFGMDVLAEAEWAYKELLKAYHSDPSTRLMLAGYSRGGSAVIMAAELLSLRNPNISIHSMFLFDAVARHAFPGGEIIPSNVQFSRHARRSQNIRLVLRYEGTISDHSVLGNTSNPLRPSFGNTGLQWRGNGDHESPTAFEGSHGALGGVGWPFVEEDKKCQEMVATWMNGHLTKRLGRPFKLVATAPSGGASPKVPSRVVSVAGKAIDLLMLTKHGLDLLTSGWVPDEEPLGNDPADFFRW
jgi:hypothetical protein